jgi:hypothetical protein
LETDEDEERRRVFTPKVSLSRSPKQVGTRSDQDVSMPSVSADPAFHGGVAEIDSDVTSGPTLSDGHNMELRSKKKRKRDSPLAAVSGGVGSAEVESAGDLAMRNLLYWQKVINEAMDSKSCGMTKGQKSEVRGAFSSVTTILVSETRRADAAEARAVALQNVMDSLQSGIDRLQTSIAELRASRPVEKMEAMPRPSFAEVASRAVSRAVERKTGVVVIRPEVPEGATVERTKAAVKEALNPTVDGFRVVRVTGARGAGVVVETSTKEEAQKILGSAKLRERGLKAAEPIGRLPRLVIYDTPRELSDEDFLKEIYEGNLAGRYDRALFMTSAKRVAKFGPREHSLVGSVIVCPGAVRALLLEQGHVFLGWSACRVRDFIGATRCHKCHLFGHVEAACRSSTVKCARCAGDGHREPDCQSSSDVKTCASCAQFRKRGDHPTGDRDCPVYRAAVDRVAASTNYNG